MNAPEPILYDKSAAGRRGLTFPELDVPRTPDALPARALRTSPVDLPEVSEGELVRHFTRLSVKNHHVDRDLFPLGSCTMKYNPKFSETLLAEPGIAGAHPLQPESTAQGLLAMLHQAETLMAAITGLDACTYQPAAGAHGEFTGLKLISAYHRAKGLVKDEILIPDSAHGTNPASASLAGYKTVEIKTGKRGLLELEEVRSRLNDRTACLMVTNPSTLGLFETQLPEIARLLHERGALVYMDGANLNGIVGVASPGKMGVDVIQVNAHKTFASPHGGGGPCSGPVCVRDLLIPYLPGPRVEKRGERYALADAGPASIGRMHPFYGNFAVMLRMLLYVLRIGAPGLRRVGENAVLNANYLRARLAKAYPMPYPGICKHEFVVSLESWKTKKGVTALDVAKRLLDYGFYAPTVYFPLIVKEALLIEPTETESRETLDRFADAMLAIAREADETPDVLKEAPHAAPLRRLNEADAARNCVLCQW
ncbi:MAG TPA: aminomethyl-transferring glycine dehydrogenase subunit GcvPB [Planctomycetota bacterium]